MVPSSGRCSTVSGKSEATRPLKISRRADLHQTRITHQLHDQSALIMVVLEQKPTPRRQPLWRSVHHSANRIKPILSSTQRQMWFMVSNNGLETMNN